MRRAHITLHRGFQILAETERSQAASMVLEPGEATGGPDNRHADSDQWMFVLSGKGHAKVGDQEVDLEEGDLLMIEAGETHQISNPGGGPLETLNIYAPRAY